MDKLKILLVDDESRMRKLVKDFLVRKSYDVVEAENGEQAIDIFFARKDIALIILDVMMPKEDGYEVCRKIRSKSNVPVILITARGEDFDKIMGLDIGADDYIVKPFSPREVMARVRAVLRRMTKTTSKESVSENVLSISNLEINLDEYTLHIGGEKVSLTKKEIETMWTLATNPNKVFTRDNLLDSLWGFDYFGDSRTVDSHIKRLRSKLDSTPHPAWNIKTIWGVGYKFEVEEK